MTKTCSCDLRLVNYYTIYYKVVFDDIYVHITVWLILSICFQSTGRCSKKGHSKAKSKSFTIRRHIWFNYCLCQKCEEENPVSIVHYGRPRCVTNSFGFVIKENLTSKNLNRDKPNINSYFHIKGKKNANKWVDKFTSTRLWALLSEIKKILYTY